ncbi:MAG: protein-glutamate O-methyltransferase CheR [Gammaproteobacteria bacterium]|nr:protein-glutamate O-methyltransferase CheR [Gammaproteobacteria bacterium]
MNPVISPSDYDRFKLFLEQACGIILGNGKEYLIASRLTKLLRDEKIASVAELLTAIERGHPRQLRDDVIDAMTTNETSWFRDRSPFEALQKVVFPEMDRDGKRQCRIWSSACSSGQEPYTISIALSEYLKTAAASGLATAQIMATDISKTMLNQAKQAEYEEGILGRGLSPERKQLFFRQVGERWTVSDEVKRRVSFREQNLLLSYGSLGKFDIIFCRNVLIYFSAERKTDILNRMALALNPDGYLFLGASETITGYTDVFEMVRSPHGVFYRLKAKS